MAFRISDVSHGHFTARLIGALSLTILSWILSGCMQVAIQLVGGLHSCAVWSIDLSSLATASRVFLDCTQVAIQLAGRLIISIGCMARMALAMHGWTVSTFCSALTSLAMPLQVVALSWTPSTFCLMLTSLALALHVVVLAWTPSTFCFALT